ncbi:ATP synthase F0 subcomplex subunit OSCP atp5 [Balamuthia mandrillaris]
MSLSRAVRARSLLSSRVQPLRGVVATHSRTLFAGSMRGYATSFHEIDQDLLPPSNPTPEDFEAIKTETISPEEEALRKKITPAPIKFVGASGRAAAQLFEMASINQEFDTVEGDLKKIVEALQQDEELQAVIVSCAAPREDIVEFTKGLVPRLNLSATTAKWIDQILEDHVSQHLPKIYGHFKQLLSVHRRETPVTFTFAKIPEKQTLEFIVDRVLSTRMPRGARPLLNIQEDPKLLDGFKVEIADTWSEDYTGAALKAESEALLRDAYNANVEDVLKNKPEFMQETSLEGFSALTAPNAAELFGAYDPAWLQGKLSISPVSREQRIKDLAESMKSVAAAVQSNRNLGEVAKEYHKVDFLLKQIVLAQQPNQA